jgi:hypothetical protein
MTTSELAAKRPVRAVGQDPPDALAQARIRRRRGRGGPAEI